MRFSGLPSSTSGLADFDFDVATDQINSYVQGSAAGSYTVQQGDTLQGIAATLWRDGSLWYKLASVNGLSAASALPEGTQLTLPGGVIRDTNSSSTFRPYDPGEILGNVNRPLRLPPSRRRTSAGRPSRRPLDLPGAGRRAWLCSCARICNTRRNQMTSWATENPVRFNLLRGSAGEEEGIRTLDTVTGIHP